jgi:[ribosomal protein S5]-alanine N-acetyltransferase
MDGVGEVRLVTPRLLIRDFDAVDLPEVHALRSDPEVARFMDFAPETLEESRGWLTEVIFHNRQRPRRAYNLAIVHTGEDRAIGWIGIGRSGRHPAEGELGFGYMLHRAYWGRGLATEATRAILAFGFGRLGGTRASAWCYAENRASARVLEKAGLRFVRRYRDVEPKSGQLAECLEWAVRADEWCAATGETR